MTWRALCACPYPKWAKKQAQKMSKADKLGQTDHAATEYVPFRKNFYIESYEIARLSKDEAGGC